MSHFSPVKSSSFNQLYLRLLRDLRVEPQFKSAPRGQAIHEIVCANFTITCPSSAPLRTGDADRDAEIFNYYQKEQLLFRAGLDKATDMATASKFWLKIANPDGTINSNYGKIIWKDRTCGNSLFAEDYVTPWNWAKSKLIEDADTRQAIMQISRPDHLWDGNKDVTCTMYCHFFIRENKLILCSQMRSQDIWLGMPYDCPWFMGLMETMRLDLVKAYPTLELGYYHHGVDSLHLYERNFKQAEELIAMQLGKTCL